MKALIVSCFDNYDYNVRTKFVEQLLIKRGYEVSFLVSNFDHRSKKAYTTNRNNVSFIKIPFYKKNLSFKRLLACVVFAKRAAKFVEKQKYDLIYNCAPPNSTIKEFAKLKRRRDFKLITEIGDMWPESIPITAFKKRLLSLPFSIWKRIRDKYLCRTDYLITECDLFKDELKKNGYLLSSKTLYFCREWAGNSSYLSTKEEVSFLYLGSINNLINIDTISLLLSEVSKYKRIVLHIIGDGEQADAFLQQLNNLHIRYVFHGLLFDEAQKSNIFAKCHFALNVMKNSVFVGMTMKSLDYFSYGLPIINNIGGDTSRIVSENGVGFNITGENYKKIAETVSNITDEEYSIMRDKTYKTFVRYFGVDHYMKEMDEVLNIVENE